MATEDQAKKQWCPMVRASTGEEDRNSSNAGVALNAISERVAEASRSPQYARCIAGKCAMWRWGGSAPRSGFIVAADTSAMTEAEASGPGRGMLLPPESWEFCPADIDEGAPAGWYEPAETAAKRREGYCGMAGKPEFAP